MFYQSRQRADTNQVIVDQTFWNADHENQMRALMIFTEWNASPATPDADDNFIYQICASVRKDHGVFNHTRVRLLTLEDLFEKRLRIGNFPWTILGSQHLHDLANRVRRFSRAQLKDDLFFIQ